MKGCSLQHEEKIWLSIGVVSIIVLLVGVNVYRAMSKEEVTVSTVKLSQQEIASNVMVPGTLRFQNEQYIYQDPEKGKLLKF
ncbi:hypothetical protein MGI18_11430 [Bacillus sp. OVS6]|nr:hypothetical protein MGI18_11430 [Bacillus sp. OVS6]